jgi:hypothetical protein
MGGPFRGRIVPRKGINASPLWVNPERTRPGEFINTGRPKETLMKKLTSYLRKLRFSKDVRLSLADQFKKTSWRVPALLALLGYDFANKQDSKVVAAPLCGEEHHYVLFFVSVVLFLVCQLVAHAVLAYEDTS